MNPNALRVFSYIGILIVLALSSLHFYDTWKDGEPRWYFLIMAFSIALLLSYNLIKKNKR